VESLLATAAQSHSVSSKKVLVVDDNSAVRAALSDFFLGNGFGMCVEAENGMKAIDAALACKPDLIILDLAMPVMNGLEAAPKLKKLSSETPIILFSLNADYLRSQELTSLGLDAVFSKNDPLDRLLEKAHQLIGK
jgi:CheY-like chemotaxis protein